MSGTTLAAKRPTNETDNIDQNRDDNETRSSSVVNSIVVSSSGVSSSTNSSGDGGNYQNKTAEEMTAEDLGGLERLPSAAPWAEAPTCPAWGPMDGFYEQGIRDEQVHPSMVQGITHTHTLTKLFSSTSLAGAYRATQKGETKLRGGDKY